MARNWILETKVNRRWYYRGVNLSLHGCFVLYRTPPYGSDPTKDFDSSGDSYDNNFERIKSWGVN
jgi:hypothetical protein